MNKREDVPNDSPGNVHWKLYGKVDKVNSPQNQNPEFQTGYRIGVDSIGYNSTQVIEEEHALRREVKDDLGKGFAEWKRGFWAARSQLIVCPLQKKRKRCYDKYFGEKSDTL